MLLPVAPSSPSSTSPASSSSSSASLFQHFDWLIDWLSLIDTQTFVGFSLPVWPAHCLSLFHSLFLPLLLLLSSPFPTHCVCVCVVYVCVCRVINTVYFISRQPALWSKTAAVAMLLFTLGQLDYLPHCALTWCCTWNFSTDNNNKS